MACKRTATRDINQDNWNDEDEPEDAGTFVKASQEVLEKRVVRAARRRLPKGGDGSTKSAFGSFAGFKTTSAPVSSPFSFLAKPNNSAAYAWSPQTTNNPPTVSPTSNGASKTPENGTDGPTVSFPSMDSVSKPSELKKTEQSNKEDQFTFNKSSEYFAKLKGLNESVTQWIKTHVDSNPFCILTPIFRDYERYFKDIEAKHGNDSPKSIGTDRILEPPKATSSLLKSDASAENRDTSADKTEKSGSDGTKSFGTLTGSDWGSNKSVFGTPNPNAKSVFATASENTEQKPFFGGTLSENNPFLSKTASATEKKKEGNDKTESDTPTSGTISFSQTKTASTFSFGQSSSTGISPSAGFSFGSSKPFSFGSHVIAPQDSESKKENEEKEDEDEPPKPDFKPITEEGAFFEKRCKVFVKKDGNFSDRGIGVLFLKSTPNNKTQLIVRADNSLGNLLLNTLLTTTIPTKRMNKNTVMLVCLPLPDSEGPPTPVLLRVKTSEDADTLLQTLDDNKK